MKSLEAEKFVAAGNEHLKERYLALGLDFHNTAYSLSFIRDKLNENSTLSCTVTNRTYKEQTEQTAVCFTYPSNKCIYEMMFLKGHDPQFGRSNGCVICLSGLHHISARVEKITGLVSNRGFTNHAFCSYWHACY